MRTADLRKRLIEEINASSNRSLLEEMYNFFSLDNVSDDVFKLSKSQKLAIQKGREQVTNGQIFTDEEVNSEIDKWLSEK
jgi:hypothetical protein